MPPPECPPAPEYLTVDLDAQAEELRVWLADKVFHESNLESTTSNSATWRLSGEKVCDALDADCLKLFSELPFRVVVRAAGAQEYDAELVVGSASVAVVRLAAGGVGMTATLAGVKAAEKAAAETLGQAPQLPERFSGKVQASVVRHGSNDYTATLAILEEINIGQAEATSRQHWDVKLAPAPKAFELRLNRQARSLLSGLDLEALEVVVALDQLFGTQGYERCEWPEDPTLDPVCEMVDPRHYDGAVEVRAAGASAKGAFAILEDELSFTEVGLGAATSTVKYGQFTLFSADLNQDHQRKLDLKISAANPTVEVEFSPALDLQLLHDLTSLQAQLDDIPSWLLQGAAPVKLDGALKPRLESVENDGAGPERVLRMTAGTLTLAASGHDPVVVAAPGCLIAQSGGGSPHPIATVAAGVGE